MRLGFLGLPIDRSKGPRRNLQEISEGCDAAAWVAWSSGSKVFPGSCLMLLNVIKSMGCSRELTERNWKSNRRSCIVNIYTCIHTCKDQSAYFTGIDNSMAYLVDVVYPADVVIASGAYMVRQRSRRRLARSPQMHTTF